MTLLCKVMLVSRSGFYRWLEQRSSVHQQMNEKLLPLVREIHRESKGTYGTRRVAKALRELVIPCGRRRARTLMKLAGLSKWIGFLDLGVIPPPNVRA